MKIRLRSCDHSVPVSIDADGKVMRATLIPNQFVEVPEAIYHMLHAKFALPSDRLVPDYNENERHPHRKDEGAIMRQESKPGYVLEFQP